MERYLHTYINYNQANWDQLLLSAEFAINAAVSETTHCAPFVATCSYLLQMSFNADALQSTGATACKRVAYSKAHSIAELMQAIWDWTRA